MSAKRLALLGAALLLVPGTGQAQSAPGMEVGAFGKYTVFDDAVPLDNRAGGGGRLGFYFLPNLMLEADLSHTVTESPVSSRVTYTPVHARLIYALPLTSRISFLLGGGYVRNLFGAGLTDESGASGLAGLRIGFSEDVALRLDGSADYIPKPWSGADNGLNWGAQAGLSFLVGRRGPGDRDRDGVTDDLDACPNTPLGEAVDARGCPLPKDSDRDGVIDPNDACPDTPAGERVDARGCPLPKDSDGDGVVDPNDACPNTPAGERVDARGCPLPKDSDGDGVMDPNDACPDTPAGTRVDARGCPELFEEGRTELVLEGVNFEVNSAQLTPAAQAILDRVAPSLVANPDVRVEVAGHTDNTGARSYNLTLSQRRAESVRNYLIQKGVPAAQVSARGYGPDNPIASNATREGRAQNRRVELRRMQ